MSKWLNNTKRIYKFDEIEKPCHKCGFCPYGYLVEVFPLFEMAKKYAIKHKRFVKWVPAKDPKPYGRGEWVKCKKGDKGAGPDLNWAVPRAKDPCSCKVFGYDCPVFYHAESLKEKAVK